MELHRKVLIISYHFPPSLAVGGHRLAGFARYLTDYGWEPHVLTIREELIEKKDPSTLNGLNNITIYRTGRLLDISDLYISFKEIYYSIKNGRKVTRDELIEIFQISKNETPQKTSRNKRFKDYILSLFVTMPDKERNWVLPALNRAAHIIKENRYSCILTSSPPYSVHFIGYILKILYNIGWVADFRDPWMTPLGKKLYPTTPLSNRIELKIEKMIIEKADLVVGNTEPLIDEMVSKFRKLPEKKFVYLSNGYDAASFHLRSKTDKYEKFTICYTGTLYLGRSPEPIFKALQEIQATGEYDIRRIQLLLVGNCNLINGVRTSELISSYRLASVVKVIGPIPHNDALEIICKSHLALLLAPDQPFQIPGKIFEYIGAGTKILAIAGKGATADLIDKNGFGKVFSPCDVEGIKGFILQSVSRCSLMNLQNSNRLVEKYNRKYLVGKLAKYLEDIKQT